MNATSSQGLKIAISFAVFAAISMVLVNTNSSFDTCTLQPFRDGLSGIPPILKYSIALIVSYLLVVFVMIFPQITKHWGIPDSILYAIITIFVYSYFRFAFITINQSCYLYNFSGLVGFSMIVFIIFGNLGSRK
jgi:hypothetical protein